MQLECSITVEINLYFEDSESPDVMFEYASNLTELKKAMSDEFLEEQRIKYGAIRVTVGKIEFVSLRDKEDGPVCRDNRVILSVDEFSTSVIIKENELIKNKKRD